MMMACVELICCKDDLARLGVLHSREDKIYRSEGTQTQSSQQRDELVNDHVAHMSGHVQRNL